MIQVEELDIQIEKLKEQVRALNEECSSLKAKREKIRLHPLAKKYEGRYFKFGNDTYGYIKRLQEVDNDFINFEGLYLVMSDNNDNYYMFTNEGEACMEEIKEITKEDFTSGISNSVKIIKADFELLLK